MAQETKQQIACATHGEPLEPNISSCPDCAAALAARAEQGKPKMPESLEGVRMTPPVWQLLERVIFRAYMLGSLDAASRVLAYSGRDQDDAQRKLCATISRDIAETRAEKVRRSREAGDTYVALTGARLT